MRRLICFVLLVPFSGFAAEQPKPADFPIRIHVVSSRARTTPQIINNGMPVQFLETIIDNQQVELGCYSQGVLALGDYQARLSTKVHSPAKHPNTYDIFRGYDLLMPDQVVRTCFVSGLGPVPAMNP